MANRGKFLLAGVVVVIAVAYLMVSSTGSSAQFFVTVDELAAMGPEATQRRLTVSGAVLGDSIVYESSVPRVTFTIVNVPGDPKAIEQAGGLAMALHRAVSDPAATRLVVVYESVKPDLLTNEAQAIARGRLGADGRFHAEELLLKCPSRYESEVPDQADSP